MGLIDKLQAKLEIYRLEQRYTRRKNRTTYATDAQYVDGEYIYNSDHDSPTVSANSTGSSQRSKRQTALWTPAPHRR
ncbi:hypothetical protein A1O1_03037 [Capronia coronata CBS 617.96]|uniref:Uncharacterized protein n=1 Tax=Capronia coronata CBS 617.96 TaxID=1182541 RepID=W9YZC0_9EURO|nr:uncharacterized protein A1O1_03037 [Capronia coronata CBS 617.96]EXJ94641.1 hypothetical protein A1O1_03037 [Capronia coronata CBS 617.96]